VIEEVQVMRKKGVLLCGVFLCAIICLADAVLGAPEDKIPSDARCAICGMFVAKYQDWNTQVRMADNSVMYFDGVKDMLVFYFNPNKFSGFAQKDILEIWVKDYYKLQWMDGFHAFYVVGSDIYGPMGKEFIAFATRAAAENFLNDHKGTKVLTFAEITDELVQSMRTTKMRHN